jgi:phosphonate transport system substrate-binding protein
MNKRYTRRFSLSCVVAAILLTACISSSPPSTEAPANITDEPAETQEGRAIVLGEISDDPSETIEAFQPFADYLASQLADQGITEGRVKVVSSSEEMVAALESGEIDLYFDSVYPATIVSDASGARPILRRWKDGVEEYHSVIFTTPDSGIESLEDLNGHMIAFEEDVSTAGFMLPLAYLIEHGLNPVEKGSPEDEVGLDEVGYVFSGDDANSADWVFSGLVSAAATNNIYIAEDVPAESADNLVVLGETEPLPRHVAVASPTIDEELLTAITEALMGADKNADGQAALEAFEDTTRLDAFPEGIDQALARMRELLEIIRSAQEETP